MKKFSLALLLILFNLISPQKSFAAEANYNINPPEPVPVRSDIGIAISGKGFGTYVLHVDPSPENTIYYLQFTVNQSGCVKNAGNTVIFKTFNCSVTNKDTQEWTLNTVRVAFANPTTVRILLNPNKLIDSSFIVGELKKAPYETLTVKVYSSSNPSYFGPFSDATANDLIIEWGPAIANSTYEITTTLPQFPALPNVTCISSVCSTKMTVPKNATTGVHKVTVKQKGEATQGSTTFKITSSTVDEPSPPPIYTPPPLPLNCVEGLDTTGKVTTKENKNAEWTNCTKIDTAVGPFDITAEGFVKKIFAILLSLSGGIAVILIIVSGYRLMGSQGNPEKIQAAREQLTSAIIGLLFIIFSVAILQIIGVDILRLPGINR